MVNVHYQRVINATPQVLRDTLLNHQSLSDFFNATFKVLKVENDGEVSGGVGCVREVCILGIRFKEEIVKADTDGIEYRVVDDFPVKDHRGVIRFFAQGSLTKVSYRISCCAPWYIPNGLLTRLLQKDVEQCLSKLGARFDPR